MGIKSQVLACLEEKRGGYLSGAAIAGRLGVSRNAVWKAVRSLQQEGHQIQAVTNKGYCLSEEDAVLSREGIEKSLRGAASGLRLMVRGEVTSTNTVLKQQADAGEPEGKVLVAERQTMGKGRSGRSFYSPDASGVYFSILLRPKFSLQESLLITTAAAVAVAQAIDAVAGDAADKAMIKWVNDVYFRGKKVCGILTEASVDFESGGLAYAVLGIGINVTDPKNGFPEEIREVAGSLYGNNACGGAIRNRLVAETINRFMQYYETLTARGFMEEYRQRSVVIGRTVEAYDQKQSRLVKVLGINDDAALFVEEADGSRAYLTTGEVRIRPADGSKVF